MSGSSVTRPPRNRNAFRTAPVLAATRDPHAISLNRKRPLAGTQARVAAEGMTSMSRVGAIALSPSPLRRWRFPCGPSTPGRDPEHEPGAGARLRRCAAILTMSWCRSLPRLDLTARVLAKPARRRAAVPDRRAYREALERVTVLVYGHGDTVRGFNFALGRGAGALDAELSKASAGTGAARLTTGGGAWSTSPRMGCRDSPSEVVLGFNMKLLIEMGEGVRFARSARAVRTPQGRAAQGRWS